jgi:glycyl-tRNA synthetase
MPLLIASPSVQGTEYCYVNVRKEGKPAARVLAEELPNLLKALRFAKSMRWRPHDNCPFSRPLRWLLALHGCTEVPFAFGGLVAGRTTRLLRTSENPTASISAASDYMQIIGDAGIVVDATERQERIWWSVQAAAKVCFLQEIH